jgi:DNA-binding GntR family transcriptional regulator
MAQNNQAQEAYERIREKLISRTLEPASRLKESTWAIELKVNRADVRQALSRLLGEGLLVAGGKGGFFVREFSAKEMEQFNEVRFMLEKGAASLAIDRATKEDISELQHVAGLMALMAENGYAMGVFEADLHFHERLIKAAHNERLEHLYKSANLPLTMTRAVVSADKERLLDDAAQHRGIVDAIEKKDLQKAVELLAHGLGGEEKPEKA